MMRWMDNIEIVCDKYIVIWSKINVGWDIIKTSADYTFAYKLMIVQSKSYKNNPIKREWGISILRV
jgi:hypothetical protein